LNRAEMEAAVASFLRAAGLSLANPNLRDTPKRVAAAWASEFLDGYLQTPEEVLGETYPAPGSNGSELVLVTDLHFHSTCPHHLLPYEGRAHLAYVPSKRVVGFGRLSALLDCFAHRLILQEELARNVASALAEQLESPATACILDAKQACLRLRGHRQLSARTHVEAYEGRFRRNRALRKELWARLGAKP
jgi:GTP cyclohydrolase I